MKLDYILHFFAGYFFASCFQFTDLWMIAIATFVGVIKELWDKYIEKEKFDWRDLILTFAGGFTAYCIERAI